MKMLMRLVVFVLVSSVILAVTLGQEAQTMQMGSDSTTDSMNKPEPLNSSSINSYGPQLSYA